MRFLLSLVVALLLTSPVLASDLAAEKSYVDKVIAQAFQTIKDTQSKKLTTDAAKKQFRGILNSSFDVPTIARFTMGRYWRVATPAEQVEFRRLLQKVILDKYADRLLEFSGDRYTIDGARALNDKDTLVNSTIYPNDKPPVKFDWRLRKAGNVTKVIDLSVEGISMSVTHRTDFAGVIEGHGGKVKALLDALQDKEKAQKLIK